MPQFLEIGKVFQSTLPIREETIADAGWLPNGKFQSTLPIREETVPVVVADDLTDISIHSSHTGRDEDDIGLDLVAVQFQSTLPIREETKR